MVIRCGLRLQIRFLLMAAVVSTIALILQSTGLPAFPLAVLCILLLLYSIKFWHAYATQVLARRTFRMPGVVLSAGDLSETVKVVRRATFCENTFADRRAAR